MTERDALLAAIVSHPEDDLARLIYADWLDENSEPERAEFIRVQCEIPWLLAAVERWAQTPSNKPGGSREDGGKAGEQLAEAQILQRREAELFRNAGLPGWFDGLPGAYRRTNAGDLSIDTADGMQFLVRRGFVSTFRGRWDQWQAHANSLVWWPARACEKCKGVGAVGVREGLDVVLLTTIQCYACRGTGSIPGAMMPCPGGNMHREDCPKCLGSCRIARPFPAATAQPITEVTLTTWPDGMTQTGVGSEEIYRESAVSELRSRWPSVEKWTLPTHLLFELQGLPLPIQHSDFTFSVRLIAESRLPVVYETGFPTGPT